MTGDELNAPTPPLYSVDVFPYRTAVEIAAGRGGHVVVRELKTVGVDETEAVGLSPDGQVTFRMTEQVSGNTVLDALGNSYGVRIAARKRQLVSRDTAGAERWHVDLSDLGQTFFDNPASPVIFPDVPVVYFDDQAEQVYLLIDSELQTFDTNGQRLWKIPLQRAFVGSIQPFAYGEGLIAITQCSRSLSRDRCSVVVLGTDGVERWRWALPVTNERESNSVLRLAIGPGGRVFFQMNLFGYLQSGRLQHGSVDSSGIARIIDTPPDASGNENWFDSLIVPTANDAFAVLRRDGHVAAFDANGTMRFQVAVMNASGALTWAPLATQSGHLFALSSAEVCMYAVTDGHGEGCLAGEGRVWNFALAGDSIFTYGSSTGNNLRIERLRLPSTL